MRERGVRKRAGDRRGWLRRGLFAAMTAGVALVLALAAAELGLRALRPSVEAGGGELDPGLFTHHPRLGWTLRPNWRGRHRHPDYDVIYTINRFGHRGTAATGGTKPPGERRYAYLGDSFTFAMGVADDQTFTEVLNRNAPPSVLHLNFGVPGYSTDQELLFAEDRLFGFEPDVVLLVVYLGNDLIDNMGPYPLQVDFAKPYFVLGGGRLALQGVPVPKRTKPAALRSRTLTSVVLGGDPPPASPIASWLGRSEILRRLGYRPPAADISVLLTARLSGALDLFQALVDRLRRKVRAQGARLTVVLLPGRSFVDDAAGYSAQYQEFLRAAILRRLAARRIDALDLATPLRAAHAAGRRDLYFPREGHLTAAGNRFVAERIAAYLAADSDRLGVPASAQDRSARSLRP